MLTAAVNSGQAVNRLVADPHRVWTLQVGTRTFPLLKSNIIHHKEKRAVRDILISLLCLAGALLPAVPAAA